MPLRRTPQSGLVDRLWRVLGRLRGVAGLSALAGLVFAVVPDSAWRELTEPAGWLEPLGRPAGLRAGMAIAAAALVVFVARMIEPGLGGAGSGESRARASRRTRWLLTGGWLLVAAGAGTTAAAWFVARGDVAPGAVTLSQGRPAEAYPSRVAGESLDVMLPRRLELTELNRESGLEMELRFFEPGGGADERFRVAAGQSVEVGGYRFAPVRLEPGADRLRGTFVPADRPERSVVATPGESLQLPGGSTTYRVRDVVDNYMQSQGPAAQLAPVDGRPFWVFERRPSGAEAPDLDREVRLVDVDRVREVVVSVAPAHPIWPHGVAGGLIAFGIASLLMVPGPRERVTDESSSGRRG